METVNPQSESVNQMSDKDFSDLFNHIPNADEPNTSETTEESNTEDNSAETKSGDDFKPEGKEEEKQTEENSTTPESVSLGDFLDAEFFLKMLNVVLPPPAMLVLNKMGYKTVRKMWVLSNSEIKLLVQPTQGALKYIKINLKHPLYKFAFCIGMIYAMKIGTILATVEREKKGGKQSKRPMKTETVEEVKEVQEEETDIVDEEILNQYTDEEQSLIRATCKRRNFTVEQAIASLEKSKQLKRKEVEL